jgi:hypothetical protein
VEAKPVRADRSPQLQERMPPAVLQPARALAAVRRVRPLATVLPVLARVGRRRTAGSALAAVARRATPARMRPPGRAGRVRSAAPAAPGRVRARQPAATQPAQLATAALAAPVRSHQRQALAALAVAVPPPTAAKLVQQGRPERVALRGYRAAEQAAQS